VNNIFISNDISELEALIPSNKKIFVIIDNKLKHYYKLFSNYSIIKVETSEKNKTLSTIESIMNKLLDLKGDRNSFLLGVGGGITTDICGFAASIYKRGVSFGFVPTTLLAQCDASIGGKNGVNFNYYKNIIGTINQPSFVYINPVFLNTLPQSEIINGSAEIIKTFILFDPIYYKKCVLYFSQKSDKNYINNNDSDLLDIVRKCALYKQSIIEKDPFEKGERRLLNLGHTFAHAIEKCITSSNTKCTTISHGEAVSIGIIYAARIAEKLSIAKEGLSGELVSDLLSMGLPVNINEYNLTEQQLFNAIINDKKVDGDKIHFILPLNIGNVIDKEIKLDELEEISRDLY
jgi:3-dehydroquinate synthetase